MTRNFRLPIWCVERLVSVCHEFQFEVFSFPSCLARSLLKLFANGKTFINFSLSSFLPARRLFNMNASNYSINLWEVQFMGKCFFRRGEGCLGFEVGWWRVNLRLHEIKLIEKTFVERKSSSNETTMKF